MAMVVFVNDADFASESKLNCLQTEAFVDPYSCRYIDTDDIESFKIQENVPCEHVICGLSNAVGKPEEKDSKCKKDDKHRMNSTNQEAHSHHSRYQGWDVYQRFQDSY
ncbi:hypothetical protein H920_03471 [Fukomys damarensis]|uniref:Uncharacterized protein n=1 Tax=Fukomys damarensis TaxID=885580 RepID=A0A091EI40_FUKDA|nr:hypothetical protein H920_03471 [Fukomys damarensis]